MAKKKKSQLLKYLTDIEKKSGVQLTEDNYKQQILKRLESPPDLLNYFTNYMAVNESKLGLKWGCLMYLFIRADNRRDVTEILRYYNSLRNYPLNYFTEVTIGELELRFKGKLLAAKDKYLLALELKPNDAYTCYELGFTYFLLGAFKKSIYYYEQAAENYENAAFPNDLRARALFNIAVQNVNLYDNHSEAIKRLHEALELKPDYQQAKQALKTLTGRGFFNRWRKQNAS